MKEKKYAPIQVKASKDEDRVVEFIATDENIIDYDQEIVKVDGMNFDNLMSGNKSFLWSHLHTELPIGKIIDIKKYKTKVKGKAQMVSEEEYPFGYQVFKLIKGGYLNNVSIGFVPDYDSIEYKDVKGKRVRVINKSDVFEISAVNVGANRNAMITNVKSIKQNARVAWDDEIIDGKELNQLEDELDILTKDFETVEENELKELKERLTSLEEKLNEIVEDKEVDEEKEYDDYISKLFEDEGVSGGSKDATTENQTEDEDSWIDEYI